MKTSAAVLLFLSLFELNSGLFRKHYYVKQNKKWDDARKYCRDNYDDLSIFTNDDIQQFSQNPDITDQYYWIGLHRDAKNLTIWRWPDNVEAVMDRWGLEEPNSVDQECGGVWKDDSTLFDATCDWQLTFYCMEVYDLVLIQQNKTWEEALDYCKEKYTDLASLYNNKMMDKAMVINAAAQTDDVWTGLRFLAGQWFWVKGEDLQYKAWSLDEDFQCPVMSQHCGAVKRDIKVWKLKNCVERLNFLCVNESAKTMV